MLAIGGEMIQVVDISNMNSENDSLGCSITNSSFLVEADSFLIRGSLIVKHKAKSVYDK